MSLNEKLYTHSACSSCHVYSDATIPHVVLIFMIGTSAAPRHSGWGRRGGIRFPVDGGITVADSVVHGDAAVNG